MPWQGSRNSSTKRRQAASAAKEAQMASSNLTDRKDVRELVRQKYGEAALRVLQGQGGACCGGTGEAESTCCGGEDKAKATGVCCSNGEVDPITSDLYSDSEASEIPETALLASLGGGNPPALAQRNEGEIVLDLASGGVIDVLLSARRVGPSGFAYGLDMTDEMLALANKNAAAQGANNVAFLKGHIEDI